MKQINEEDMMMDLLTMIVLIVAICVISNTYKSRKNNESNEMKESNESTSKLILSLKNRIENLETIVLERERAKRFAGMEKN